MEQEPRTLTLGDRLYKAREHAGLLTGSSKPISQDLLAERTGLSQQTISNIETGKAKESAAVVALALSCGVRAEWLAEGIGAMFEDPHVRLLSRKIEVLPHAQRVFAEKMLNALLSSIDWDGVNDRRSHKRSAERRSRSSWRRHSDRTPLQQ